MTDGKIVTFYSYKGGVGRTMALANVAFLAATNGKRVLVIDWDLEAPGLYYYFRGLTKLDLFKNTKDVPGIMDMAWEWVDNTNAATTSDEMDAVIDSFTDGTYFESLTHPLTDTDQGYVLDIITPGGSWIKDTHGIAYENALATFSWANFFEENGGGVLLESFRRWAKQAYDLVLVDSRTGVADDAGVCTVQMPDTVLMCFVMNRQNIDGVARMASVVRSRREGAIDIRVAPMRVTYASTAEEADAFSRAQRELFRVGGLSPDAIAHDLHNLAVGVSTVPFYETLAPIVALNPALDPLTLNYLRLAVEILGDDLDVPDLDPAWLGAIRHRLQPQHATIAYVDSLLSAEPDRAHSDLLGYLESARADEIDGATLDPEYVATLIKIVLTISERLDSYDSQELVGSAVALLRDLMTTEQERWRVVFVDCLERYIQLVGLTSFEPDEELSLLEELETVLSQMEPTSVLALQRISGRRRLARLHHQQNSYDLAGFVVDEMFNLIADSRALFGDGALLAAQLATAEVDGHLLRGELAEAAEHRDAAISEYRAGIEVANEFVRLDRRGELHRLVMEITTRLALLLPDDDAVQFLVRALEMNGGMPSGAHAYSHVLRLTTKAANSSADVGMLNTYIRLVFAERTSRSQFGPAGVVGRSIKAISEFMQVATHLVIRISDGPFLDAQNSVAHLNEVIVQALKLLSSRRLRLQQLPQMEDPLLAQAFDAWRQAARPFLTSDSHSRLIEAFLLLNRNATRL